MKFLLAALVGLLVLTVVVCAHKSVKEMKPLTDDHAMEHHHFHRAHRRDGPSPGERAPRDLEHHELLEQQKHELHGNDGGHHRQSAHPKHHVGPKFSDHIPPQHKSRARYDAQGNVIPHEIRDDTHHNLRHK